MADFGHRTAFHMCPDCGALLNGAVAIVDDRNPVPGDGDLTVCVTCGSIAVFDSEAFGGLRLSNEDDLTQLDAESREALALASQYVRESADP